MLAVARADINKKLRHHVSFEVELDLTPYVHSASPEQSNAASLMYELVSVTVHKGDSFDGGHWVTYSNVNAGSGVIPCCSVWQPAQRSVSGQCELIEILLGALLSHTMQPYKLCCIQAHT